MSAPVRYETDGHGVATLVRDGLRAVTPWVGDDMLDALLVDLEGARTDDAVPAVVLASSHGSVGAAGGDVLAGA